jgi:ferrous iron transport protein B
MGTAVGEKKPDLVLCVLDATNLRRNLRLVLAVKRMGLPCIVVLNMIDLAKKRGIEINLQSLSEELDLPVVSTVGVKSKGDEELRQTLSNYDFSRQSSSKLTINSASMESPRVEADNQVVQGILKRLGLDKIVLDPMQ